MEYIEPFKAQRKGRHFVRLLYLKRKALKNLTDITENEIVVGKNVATINSTD